MTIRACSTHREVKTWLYPSIMLPSTFKRHMESCYVLTQKNRDNINCLILYKYDASLVGSGRSYFYYVIVILATEAT